MFYKFLCSLLLVAMTSNVAAELKVAPLSSLCGSAKEIKDIIDSYGEKPVFMALTQRFRDVEALLILTLNPQNGSWSVVEFNKNGVNCILQSGESGQLNVDFFSKFNKTL